MCSLHVFISCLSSYDLLRLTYLYVTDALAHTCVGLCMCVCVCQLFNSDHVRHRGCLISRRYNNSASAHGIM